MMTMLGRATVALIGMAALGVPASASAVSEKVPIKGVTAGGETQLFPGQNGDTADDSAIWRNPRYPQRSLVLAGNKANTGGGIGVYNLRGQLLRYQRIGKIGNVDLRSGVRLGRQRVTLVGANDRSTNTMRFWSLNPDRATLTPVDARPLRTVAPNYGFCLGRTPRGERTYAFVSGKASGTFEQYELRLARGRVDAVKVRTLLLGGASRGTSADEGGTEGCVVDDTRGAVYIAEAAVGVWRYRLDPASGSARTSVDRAGAGRLTADVEGLAVARGRAGRGVLVASSQGSSTFAVYDLDGRNAYRGSFRVVGGRTVDGASITDGVALSAGSFGPGYPNGLLVVHDEENQTPAGGPERGSNLKFVRFDQVYPLDPKR